ncbi:MAG: YigZ family protein [Treponema sp.]|nr:YigZ family protein [Treponema sp.]
MIQVRFWRHRLLVPISSESSEIIIKGSRFLAESFIISSQNQVREILKSQKQKYSDSTHVVHAFIAGKNGEIMGMSDDGEPSGTAGRPMLDVLKGRNCTNLMITVTRWFGGTLLGTGGLVHAYGDCTKSVLEKIQFEELIEKQSFSFVVDYQQFQIVKKLLEKYELYDYSEQFGSEITISGKVAIVKFEELKLEIFDKTNGKIVVV